MSFAKRAFGIYKYNYDQEEWEPNRYQVSAQGVITNIYVDFKC
jgi:hypothetical protein